MTIPLTHQQLFSNNAVSLLTGAITTSDTSLNVIPGHGALFPQPSGTGQDYFLITLEDQSATVREIIKVTNRIGDTLYFSLSDRGLEDTSIRNWSASAGNETLVDHRITAETMQRSLQLPLNSGVALQDDGVDLGTCDTINFSGANITVSGTGNIKTVSVSSDGSGWINGSNSGQVLIEPAWNTIVSTATYSNFNRSFKFLVTVQMPTNGKTLTFEALAVVDGLIGVSEEVHWSKYAQIGTVLQGFFSMELNTTNTTISVKWQNNEIHPVISQCLRIQHL